MKGKIDLNLLKGVSTLNIRDKIECIVYAQNYFLAKNYLENNFKNQYSEFPFIKAFKINLNTTNLFKIAKLNIVKYISSSALVTAMMQTSKQIMRIENIKQKPSNFSIAIIDTGIYPHIDFLVPSNKIVLFKDFINKKTTIYDDNGHGTFVAGVVCGSGVICGKKYQGVDKKSNLIILKALDKNGETSASTILNAMQWVYDNKEKYNIKIVNMSFGSLPLGANDPLIVGAEVLWNNGIVVVGACGNSGPEEESVKSPGASTKIITVGALNDNRFKEISDDGKEVYKFDISKFEVANFSSRGPIYNNYKPDLLAPGVEITGPCNFGLNKEFYGKMSGTSVATPMITGVCSLILKEHPRLSPNGVKKLLIDNCTPITGDRNSEGFGWFNGSLFLNKK